MNQWFDQNLIAIEAIIPDRYAVLELPAQSVTVLRSRCRFKTAEQAEDYIEEQWGERGLCVAALDIAEEIVHREAIHAKDLLDALDPAKFAEWLDLYRDEDQVGIACTSGSCPIAQYLYYCGYSQFAHVNSETVEAGYAKVLSPDWVAAFVDQVDDQYPQYHSVTRSMALQILEKAKETTDAEDDR